jgi:hypothetical protein
MLEDGLLMIAMYVLRDPGIVACAGDAFKNRKKNWVELYDDVEPGVRAHLYEMGRDIKTRCKIVVTILRGSSVLKQIVVLKDYSWDMEVCLPVFRKEFSAWDGTTQIDGSLEVRGHG